MKTVLCLLTSLVLTSTVTAGPVPTFMSPEKAASIEVREWLIHYGPELSGSAVLAIGLMVLAFILFSAKKGPKNA